MSVWQSDSPHSRRLVPAVWSESGCGPGGATCQVIQTGGFCRGLREGMRSSLPWLVSALGLVVQPVVSAILPKHRGESQCCLFVNSSSNLRAGIDS
jgi:hypothetical protein